VTLEHAPGCALEAVHRLRDAAAAVGHLAALQVDGDRNVDRALAEALADGVAHFAELPDWATVTLRDVALHASLMDDDDFAVYCTCDADQ
jgi:hypothetical protein